MKKYFFCILVCVMLVMFAGCDSWLSGDYASVKPHEEYDTSHVRESLEASTAHELQNALSAQISNGAEKFVIYVSNMDLDGLETNMDKAILRATKLDPIGAFAVEKIEYEVGTSTGRTAIAVNITYNRSRSEILRIKSTQDMDEVMAVITEALEDCRAGVVVQVESYKDIDITQSIQDYVDTHPESCMEMPQVAEAIYPETGNVRVIELTFTYQTSREVLRSMQSYVQPVFRAAYLNVSGEEEDHVKFSRMYAFLMERNDYQLETSITPAYSLLRHGVGDSKAFATVYAAMCQSADLECQVISGTRSGEPWVWNLICEDGVYYHVDLIQSNAAGKLQRLYQNDMEGYVWDYSAYPIAEAPEKQIEKQTQPVGNDKSEETEESLPEETVPPETPPTQTEPETEDPETIPPTEEVIITD